MFLLAGHALTSMAVPLAFMIVAVEYPLALLAALKGQSFLTALN